MRISAPSPSPADRRCSSSPTRRVLPTPESPPSRTRVGRPALASRTASSSSANSPTRPTKWLLVNLDGMYEVSPERGCDSRNVMLGATRALDRALEVAGVALGDDGGELGMHGPGLPVADTVHLRVDCAAGAYIGRTER